MKTTNPRVIVRAPESPAAFLALAKAVLAAITANAVTFPAPNPPLAKLSADVDALDVAQTATLTRTKGTVQERDALMAVLHTDLLVLRAYVQQVADDRGAEAATAVAHAACMDIRKYPTSSKSDFNTKPSKLSGWVEVSVKVGAGRQAHQWQSSTDGAATWSVATETLRGNTTLGPFTPGSIVTFRHRRLTKSGWSDWSQPFSIRAQ